MELVEVELMHGSWVVEYGVETRRWRVEIDGVWSDPGQLPGVLVDTAADDDAGAGHLLQRPPGCQYLMLYRARVPVGTRFESIVTRPKRTGSSRELSWVEALASAQPARERVRRRGGDYFRIDRAGRLVSEATWERVRQRRAAVTTLRNASLHSLGARQADHTAIDHQGVAGHERGRVAG